MARDQSAPRNPDRVQPQFDPPSWLSARTESLVEDAELPISGMTPATPRRRTSCSTPPRSFGRRHSLRHRATCCVVALEPSTRSRRTRAADHAEPAAPRDRVVNREIVQPQRSKDRKERSSSRRCVALSKLCLKMLFSCGHFSPSHLEPLICANTQKSKAADRVCVLRLIGEARRWQVVL